MLLPSGSATFCNLTYKQHAQTCIQHINVPVSDLKNVSYECVKNVQLPVPATYTHCMHINVICLYKRHIDVLLLSVLDESVPHLCQESLREIVCRGLKWHCVTGAIGKREHLHL